MRIIYTQPKKVFIFLIAFAGLGLFLAGKLPVALYPNSAKPVYRMEVWLDQFTPRDFINEYGDNIDRVIEGVDGVERISVEAGRRELQYEVEFEWGLNPEIIKKEMQLAVENIRGQLPNELREHVHWWLRRSNYGFYAASIGAPNGDIAALKRKLDPILNPRLNKIEGVGEIGVFDPRRTYLYVTIDPEALISHRLSIDQVNRYLKTVIRDTNAGDLKISEKSFQVIIKNKVDNIEKLASLTLADLGRPGLKLSDIASVELAPRPQGDQIWRSNGEMSLIVWAQPADGGNIKEICEQINSILAQTQHQWPKGTTYQVLIDPSKFIRSAILNVDRNIVIGGLLAVLILMFFVGSIKTTVFSALEIPLAIVWAFILMYLFDVSLNLISLGGLALTAGMNIDASIVMVENIVRHFRQSQPKDYQEKLSSLLKSVNEVKIPIITSTLSTIIVFLPLSVTSGITNAILGDLAKAVVFSHGFAAVVAIILVPTVRLLVKPDTQPLWLFRQFDRGFLWVKNYYLKSLLWIVNGAWRRTVLIFGAFALVFTISFLLFPKIKKEIVAMPTTDVVRIGVNAQGLQTTEDLAREIRNVELTLLTEFEDYILNTFASIWNPRNAMILVTLKDKSYLKKALKEFEEKIQNSPEVQYRFRKFNPSRLPIPNPPHINVKLTGTEAQRVIASEKVRDELKGSRQFSWVGDKMSSGSQITLTPYFENFARIARSGLNSPNPNEINEMLHTILSQRRVGFLNTDEGSKQVRVRFPPRLISSTEELGAIPVIVGNSILPLKALMEIKQERYVSAFFKEDGNEQSKVFGYYKGKNFDTREKLNKEFAAKIKSLDLPEEVHVTVEGADKEINKALMGLVYAFGLSLCLIAAILYFQFGRILDVATVMAAIPLGLVGVSLSLWAFKSTWSINSLLGIILLAGISVNNSILIMSFFRSSLKSGKTPALAAIEAAGVRLKPILITSLTTISAMLPIAFGLGEGSEVLQPLGVSVSGGMLFSTLLTLFVVPTLGVSLAGKNPAN